MEWLIVLIIAAAVAGLILIYNRLVKKRNRVATAWSDIDVQLSRRHDLVPRLVEVVRAYAGHERQTLEQVTRLRSEALATDSPAQLGRIEGELEALLGRLIILKEDYPVLKASDNFAGLSEQLVEVEDHLQYARRFYNGAVRDLNTQVQQFPDVLVAKLFGFGPAEFYHAEDPQRSAVKVELGS